MILGITGISGTGKHTAGDFLHQKGWVIFDVDRLAHYLYRPYTHVWKQITERFGEDILNKDDTINRQKLSDIVFKNRIELDDLNKITHPAIKEHLKNEIHHLKGKRPNIAIIAALWEEVGLPEICEKILLVTADPEIAYERIRKRDGKKRSVYDSYTSKQKMPEKPDFTVDNNESFQEFYDKLNKLRLADTGDN